MARRLSTRTVTGPFRFGDTTRRRKGPRHGTFQVAVPEVGGKDVRLRVILWLGLSGPQVTGTQDVEVTDLVHSRDGGTGWRDYPPCRDPPFVHDYRK